MDEHELTYMRITIISNSYPNTIPKKNILRRLKKAIIRQLLIIIVSNIIKGVTMVP